MPSPLHHYGPHCTLKLVLTPSLFYPQMPLHGRHCSPQNASVALTIAPPTVSPGPTLHPKTGPGDLIAPSLHPQIPLPKVPPAPQNRPRSPPPRTPNVPGPHCTPELAPVRSPWRPPPPGAAADRSQAGGEHGEGGGQADAGEHRHDHAGHRAAAGARRARGCPRQGGAGRGGTHYRGGIGRAPGGEGRRGSGSGGGAAPAPSSPPREHPGGNGEGTGAGLGGARGQLGGSTPEVSCIE